MFYFFVASVYLFISPHFLNVCIFAFLFLLSICGSVGLYSCHTVILFVCFAITLSHLRHPICKVKWLVQSIQSMTHRQLKKNLWHKSNINGRLFLKLGWIGVGNIILFIWLFIFMCSSIIYFNLCTIIFKYVVTSSYLKLNLKLNWS